MNLLTVLGEVLPALATVLLLGLWLYQQTEVEQRSRELQKLASTRAVYQTYQSNNAVFNAVNEVAAAAKSERIRQFQIYNYELGLRAIEDALPQSDKRDIPPAPSAYDSSTSFETKMAQTQTRLEKLQSRLAEKESILSDAARRAKATYLRLYVGLSLIAIAGTVCKLVVKFLGPPGA
jgi:hypothetical protein